MLRFGEKKLTKEKFYAAIKPTKTWDVNIGNIIISKLIETKTSSKYLIGYSNKTIRPLVSIMPKMNGYVKTFKVKYGDKDKNNKLMSFRIYKAVWNKIEDFKNIKWNTLPVFDDRYIKTKIRTYGNKVYTNFCGLNVPEDDIECASFTVISIDSLLVYEKKYYLQVYLDSCAYKIANKQMTDYLNNNLFEDIML